MYGFLLALGITPLDGSKTHQAEDIKFITKLQDGKLNFSPEGVNQMAKLLEMPISQEKVKKIDI